MTRPLSFVVLLFAAAGLAGCTSDSGSDSSADAGSGAGQAAAEVVLYSGRSQSLTEDLIQKFEETSGIDVKVKYGNSAELALALIEEGNRSPADVFWSQDAGALGAVADAGLLAPLEASTVSGVPEKFQDPKRLWVATSGRARVLAYNNISEADLPHSVFDLTDAKYRGQVGWAPTNASFQSFVTALRKIAGEERTEQWLRDMMANETKAYAKNTPIIEALAAGEIKLGLPNHYYLLRFKSEDPEYPVKQTAFKAGDPGNLVNVAGVSVLKTADHPAGAKAFVEFMLSPEAQRFFAESTHEYPVKGETKDPDLLPMPTLLKNAPQVSLGELHDLEETLELLRKVGLL